MVAGACYTRVGNVRELGIQTLSKVETGLPQWQIPDFQLSQSGRL